MTRATTRALKKYFTTYRGSNVVSATISWARSTEIKSPSGRSKSGLVYSTLGHLPIWSTLMMSVKSLGIVSLTTLTHKIPPLMPDLSIYFMYIIFIFYFVYMRALRPTLLRHCPLLFSMAILLLYFTLFCLYVVFSTNFPKQFN